MGFSDWAFLYKRDYRFLRLLNTKLIWWCKFNGIMGINKLKKGCCEATLSI